MEISCAHPLSLFKGRSRTLADTTAGIVVLDVLRRLLGLSAVVEVESSLIARGSSDVG
jgi:hypothetical protein